MQISNTVTHMHCEIMCSDTVGTDARRCHIYICQDFNIEIVYELCNLI